MSEGVVLKFRTTKATRSRIKTVAASLYEFGLMDNLSMSQYIKDAIREKMSRDLKLLDKN